jgi:pimeloyl-ACP methyl ester carboxylesterase
MRRRLVRRRTVAPEAWQAFRFPVLCVVGLEDVVINPALGRALAGALQKGELEVFPDSGHSPYLEHAGRFNERVAGFLAAT